MQSKRIKIAFLGGGINSAVGRAHVIAIEMDKRFELVAGCFSREESINKKSADEYKVEENRVYQNLDSLIDNVYNSLTPKGSFIVGSRNRLFNLASMNSFTLQEMKDNSLEHLLIEAVAWTNSKKISNMLTIDSAAYQGSDLKHADTGIDVYTRFQYTPLQLINLLRQRGFDVIEVYPINIHCMPPLFLNDNSEINATIANLLQSISRNKSYFIPRSSSFMLHAKKAT